MAAKKKTSEKAISDVQKPLPEMTTEQVIALGYEAKQLLETIFFKNVMQALHTKYLRQLVDTEPKDVENREELYRAIRAHTAIHNEIFNFVGVGEYYQRQLETQNEIGNHASEDLFE